jgi:hypothetical protein
MRALERRPALRNELCGDGEEGEFHGDEVRLAGLVGY